MVDAILLYDMHFADDSDESDGDEFRVDSDEEGEGAAAMEDEDEDEDEDEEEEENLAWRTPMHLGDYVQGEGYKLYQKWRYAGNKKTGWDFLLIEEHDGNTPLWRRFYDNFGMRQEDFNEFVRQARAAKKISMSL